MGYLICTNHLLRDHNNGLRREPAVAVVEEVLQTRAEEINHKDVV